MLLALLLVLGAVALGLPGGPGPASASCAAPQLTVQQESGGVPALAPGSSVDVVGERFVNGCDDTGGGGGGLGCSGDEPPGALPPLVDQRLVLTQQGRSFDLGSADADPAGHVTWAVTVPDDVEPGRARLHVDGAEPLEVRVRR